MYEYDFSALKVLVVEDSPQMQKLLEVLLEAMGVGSVLLADNGARGYAIFNETAPDIIITDGSMEPMDGYALTDLIRNDEDSANPYVPIIMLSGHLDDERISRARSSGVSEYLAKPVSADTLYKRLISVVRDQSVFVRAGSYFGPDRRRNLGQLYQGPDRRNRTSGIDKPAKGELVPLPKADTFLIRD